MKSFLYIFHRNKNVFKTMLDKEKMWLGISVYFPNNQKIYNDFEIMSNIAESFHERYDESIEILVMPKYTDSGDISIDVQCIYHPDNGDSEKYNKFFEEAREYIKIFNEKYKLKQDE